METILMILVLYLLIFFLDLLPVLRRGGRKKSVVYSVIFAGTLALLLLDSMDINLSGATGALEETIRSWFPSLNR
ncbi:MAG: hypothetical protein LIO46_01160 [Clostridiales bacterium]|nr:hypothetical protein [Clostridiales bacterium]